MTSQESAIDDHAVAVLGLGRMGSAIGAALLTAGYPTTVWNRTPGRTPGGELGAGAVVAGSAAEAISSSRLVLVCLSDYDAVRVTLAGAAGELAGQAVVNLTTSTPEEAVELAAVVTAAGGHYLDGAMLAVPQTVGTLEAFFLYSGEPAVFEAHRQVLDVLATAHYLGPDPATAELWDAALLGTGYAALAGFLHGLALLATDQVPPSRFVPLVGKWLAGMVAFMPELAGEIESGDYQRGVSPVAMNLAAVEKLLALSQRRGVDPAVLAPLRGLLARRQADGHGADSFASIVELLRPSPHRGPGNRG